MTWVVTYYDTVGYGTGCRFCRYLSTWKSPGGWGVTYRKYGKKTTNKITNFKFKNYYIISSGPEPTAFSQYCIFPYKPWRLIPCTVSTELGHSHSNNYIYCSRYVPILNELHHLIGVTASYRWTQYLGFHDDASPYVFFWNQTSLGGCVWDNTSLADVSRPWTA